jgi:Ion channel
MTPVIFARFLSLDQVKSLFSEGGGHVFMDLYVLLFAALLTVILFVPTHLGCVGAFLAAYRIADIVSYRMYFLLVKSQARPWSTVMLRRSLVIVALNFYETVVAYAVLYLTVGRIVGTTTVAGVPIAPITALYYSAVTATTLGYGDYIPGNDLSRVLVMTQLFGTVLFLIFVIPALIAVFSSDKSDSQ